MWYANQETFEDFAAHILINPRYFAAEASCPDSENFTGIEITRNVFDGTEMTAIRSLLSSGASDERTDTPEVPQDDDKGNCFVEVDIMHNGQHVSQHRDCGLRVS